VNQAVLIDRGRQFVRWFRATWVSGFGRLMAVKARRNRTCLGLWTGSVDIHTSYWHGPGEYMLQKCNLTHNQSLLYFFPPPPAGRAGAAERAGAADLVGAAAGLLGAATGLLAAAEVVELLAAGDVVEAAGAVAVELAVFEAAVLVLPGVVLSVAVVTEGVSVAEDAAASPDFFSLSVSSVFLSSFLSVSLDLSVSVPFSSSSTRFSKSSTRSPRRLSRGP
jgi:hypothetical protein